MSNVDINVDGWTDGKRTPISHPATSMCDKNDKTLRFEPTMSRSADL